MRNSKVIKTFSEIKAEMEKDNKSASDIRKKQDAFSNNENTVAQDYKKISAKFDPSLAKQNQGNES